jgi:hypothetical protein
MTWMDKLASMGFKGASLVKMNRVRKFKNAHSVSDTTACDGVSLLPDTLSDLPGTSTRTWSIEQPTRENFSLWHHAMSLVYSRNGKLCSRLGSFIASPHTQNEWTLSSDNCTLCEQRSLTEFRLYERCSLLRFTRSGFEYKYAATSRQSPGFPLHATVLRLDDSTVRCHSNAPVCSDKLPPTSFLDTLLSWGYESLWDNLTFTGDGSWILDGLISGSLLIVHDGSYMPKVNTKICSTALIIYCKHTENILDAPGLRSLMRLTTIVENYSVVSALVLFSALSHSHRQVRHTDWLHRPLAEKQSQADVLRLYKKLLRELLFEVV